MNLHDACLVIKEQQAKNPANRDHDLLEAATTLFIREIHTMARAIAVRCGMSRQDGDDFIDDSAGVAIRALTKFDPSRGSASNFLFTVLLHYAYDMCSRRREQLVPDEELTSLVGSSATEPLSEEDSTLVAEMLGHLRTLSARDRVAVCLALRIEDVVPVVEWELWWKELGMLWQLVRWRVLSPKGDVDRRALAKLLGMRRGALDKVVSRQRTRLQKSLPLGPGVCGDPGAQMTMTA